MKQCGVENVLGIGQKISSDELFRQTEVRSRELRCPSIA
jgi:hypothetical protein